MRHLPHLIEEGKLDRTAETDCNSNRVHILAQVVCVQIMLDGEAWTWKDQQQAIVQYLLWRSQKGSLAAGALLQIARYQGGGALTGPCHH